MGTEWTDVHKGLSTTEIYMQTRRNISSHSGSMCNKAESWNERREYYIKGTG